MAKNSICRSVIVTAVTSSFVITAIAGAPSGWAEPTEPGAAQNASKEKPSWEEFLHNTYRDSDGQYIVDGDMPISDIEELREFYDATPGDGDKSHIADLVANKNDEGRPKLWKKSNVGNLTYCVSDEFGDDKDAIVEATDKGASYWEDASPAIDFRYLPDEDADCDTSNDNVMFSIEPTESDSYVARAFLPGASKSKRNVLLSDSVLHTDYSPEGVIGHELGHTLGFRHEHNRPEAGVCFEDDNWVPLTPYDSASIMHYPHCNGSTADMTFSPLDREGVQKAYGGQPDAIDPSDDSTWTSSVESLTGSLGS